MWRRGVRKVTIRRNGKPVIAGASFTTDQGEQLEVAVAYDPPGGGGPVVELQGGYQLTPRQAFTVAVSILQVAADAIAWDQPIEHQPAAAWPEVACEDQPTEEAIAAAFAERGRLASHAGGPTVIERAMLCATEGCWHPRLHHVMARDHCLQRDCTCYRFTDAGAPADAPAAEFPGEPA